MYGVRSDCHCLPRFLVSSWGCLPRRRRPQRVVNARTQPVRVRNARSRASGTVPMSRPRSAKTLASARSRTLKRLLCTMHWRKEQRIAPERKTARQLFLAFLATVVGLIVGALGSASPVLAGSFCTNTTCESSGSCDFKAKWGCEQVGKNQCRDHGPCEP